MDIIYHSKKFLHFLFEKIVVNASLITEERNDDCCFKLPETVLLFLEVLEEDSIEVKHVHCKLSVAAIGETNCRPFEDQVKNL